MKLKTVFFAAIPACFLMVFALILTARLPLVNAQAGSGKPYGTRDPQTCGSRVAPAKGAPSPDQAKLYFTCDTETVNYRILLVSDVKNVQVAKGRPYNSWTDATSGIDPSQLVYNIRGSFTSYICDQVGTLGNEAGKNCTAVDQPAAEGMCYKNTFGDWHCKMQDLKSPSVAMDHWRDHVAGPK